MLATLHQQTFCWVNNRYNVLCRLWPLRCSRCGNVLLVDSCCCGCCCCCCREKRRLRARISRWKTFSRFWCCCCCNCGSASAVSGGAEHVAGTTSTVMGSYGSGIAATEACWRCSSFRSISSISFSLISIFSHITEKKIYNTHTMRNGQLAIYQLRICNGITFYAVFTVD